MEKLSIIIPVYNEAKTFKQVVDDILNLYIENIIYEIIIIESNST
ncbi:MAG: glycosyltransferase, partial [Deltaproteobacteria bacterium]|nr:glycosyltransferase [Deltaproteobacteria bacterium]